jgi:hypothetical protein
MRRLSLALAAIVLAALSSPVAACDGPVRNFIRNHRPGIIVPKPTVVYSTPVQAPATYPSGGVIVQTGGCTTGNCPLSR